MGSSLGAVSRLLAPGVPGPSRIPMAISMAMWPRVEPRISEVPWKLLTRPPLGKRVSQGKSQGSWGSRQWSGTPKH